MGEWNGLRSYPFPTNPTPIPRIFRIKSKVATQADGPPTTSARGVAWLPKPRFLKLRNPTKQGGN